tara:strand:+ start:687 stop:1436 length:750 start_codon:yes stop_codon:yes gene_type:complete
MPTVGTRAQVMHGTANKTSGGLTSKDLKYNSSGRIVSRKVSALAKQQQKLKKAGYTTLKGQFGAVKIGSKHMKGGDKKYGFLILLVGDQYNNILLLKDNKDKFGIPGGSDYTSFFSAMKNGFKNQTGVKLPSFNDTDFIRSVFPFRNIRLYIYKTPKNINEILESTTNNLLNKRTNKKFIKWETQPINTILSNIVKNPEIFRRGVIEGFNTARPYLNVYGKCCECPATGIHGPVFCFECKKEHKIKPVS